MISASFNSSAIPLTQASSGAPRSKNNDAEVFFLVFNKFLGKRFATDVHFHFLPLIPYQRIDIGFLRSPEYRSLLSRTGVTFQKHLYGHQIHPGIRENARAVSDYFDPFVLLWLTLTMVGTILLKIPICHNSVVRLTCYQWFFTSSNAASHELPLPNGKRPPLSGQPT